MSSLIKNNIRKRNCKKIIKKKRDEQEKREIGEKRASEPRQLTSPNKAAVHFGIEINFSAAITTVSPPQSRPPDRSDRFLTRDSVNKKRSRD